jgi:hypothetical protein
MFYSLVLITILLGRTFYAGVRYKTLFYRELGRKLDDDKVAGYILKTLAVALTWPISLPLIGIFVIGQKFGRKEV